MLALSVYAPSLALACWLFDAGMTCSKLQCDRGSCFILDLSIKTSLRGVQKNVLTIVHSQSLIVRHKVRSGVFCHRRHIVPHDTSVMDVEIDSATEYVSHQGHDTAVAYNLKTHVERLESDAPYVLALVDSAPLRIASFDTSMYYCIA